MISVRCHRRLRLFRFVHQRRGGRECFERPLSPSDYNVRVGDILKASLRVFGLSEEVWSGEALWKSADI